MAFWIIALAAALVVGLVVAWPLLRRSRASAPRAAHDAQVFRDQLRELERDVERGQVAPEDAETTRIEVSRRLLAADAEAANEDASRPAPRGLSRGLAAALIVAAPVSAAWLYAGIGAPGAEDMPFASRGDGGRPDQDEAERMVAGRETAPPPGPEAAEFESLVERLEARLEDTPEDPEGLFLYARSLMNLGRYADAWPEFGKLIEVRGGRVEPGVYAGYAEGMILAAGGYISPEAEAALLQVLKREPTNPSGRYYIGRLHEQAGEPQLAASVWSELLAESDQNAPWVAPIRAEMARLGVEPQGGGGLAGPTADDMRAADSLPEADRQKMVAGMVNRLAERLDLSGGTAAEWRQLIRSYSVLGRQREAQAALADAREAFADDPAALAALESDAPAPPPAAPANDGFRGPTEEEMAAASDLPAGNRAAMIEGMVSRLAERLRSEGGAPEEWLRLISSLTVLGEREEAGAAYRDAREAFADDPQVLATLEAAVEGAPRAVAPAAEAPPGPTGDDIAAAAELPPEDRRRMIRAMVGRLYNRLQDEGRAADVNEWGKLMRSYRVLGDTEAIRDTYDEAVEIYAADSISLAYLKETALLNGIEVQ